MLRPKLYDGMTCGMCLFCVRSGLSFWCDEKEAFTGDHSPVWEDFVPNSMAINIYKKKFGREKQ